MSTTRRQLLTSGLGLAGLATCGTLGPALAAGEGAPRRLIVVYLNGAWDPTFHIDPKLDSPYVDGPEANPEVFRPEEEAVEQIGGHRLAINPRTRPDVITFFERWGDRVLTINGATIGGIAHNPNRTRVLTGGADRYRPDLVAWAGGQRDVTEPFGGLDLSGWGLQGGNGAESTRAGNAWQLRGLLGGGDGLAPHLPPAPTADELVEDYLRRRAAHHEHGPKGAWSRELAQSIDRVEALRTHADTLADIFDRSPSEAVNHVEVAADLVAAGFARAVLVDPRYYFDSHANNHSQNSLTNDLFGILDVLLQRLVDLAALDDTLVLVCSEMTRAPRLNGVAGKDHWPLTSYLLAGGGIAGGRQLGGTDHLQAPLSVDVHTGLVDAAGAPLGYDQVHAGLARHLGLDPAEHLPGVVPMGGLVG